MPYISSEQKEQARKPDAFAYISTYEPDEPVRVGRDEYKLKSHGSFCLRSDGVWHWKSQDIRGRSALDYLIKVKGLDFVTAAQRVLQNRAIVSNKDGHVVRNKAHVPFILPANSGDTAEITRYLNQRGISVEVIRLCIDQGIQRWLGHSDIKTTGNLYFSSGDRGPCGGIANDCKQL